MHPPLSCTHARANPQSSQGGQSKAGRSKLSLRKRRGKKKKDTRSESRTSKKSCSGVESLSETCEPVLNAGQEELHNSDENTTVREGSSSITSGEGERPTFGEKIRYKDDLTYCSQGKENKPGAPDEVRSEYRKRKEVPIPSFAAFSSSTNKKKPFCRGDENSRAADRKATINANHTLECDGAEKEANFPTPSTSQENVRNVSFVRALSETASLSFAKDKGCCDQNESLGMKLDSDSDSDLPSPVFTRTAGPAVKEADIDSARKGGCEIKCGAPYLQNKEVDRCKEVSKNGTSLNQEASVGTVMKEKSSICVIELDEDSDVEQIIDHKIAKACKVDVAERCKGKRGITHLESAVTKSPKEDDIFDVPTAKKFADRERELDTRHNDILRNLTKKPSSPLEQRKRRPALNKTERREKRSKKHICALCSTCSCSRGAALKSLEDGATEEAANPFHGLARSDTEVEKALISRLKRLEKSSAWFDHLSFKVGRELRKHRSKMLSSKNVEQCTAAGQQRPRFLADVEVGSSELVLFDQSRRSKVGVRKVQETLFGLRKNFQPTLTQLIPVEQQECSEKSPGDGSCEESKSECKSNDSSTVPASEIRALSCMEESPPESNEECSMDGKHGADKNCDGSDDTHEMNFFQIASDRLLHRLSKVLGTPGLSFGLWSTSACAFKKAGRNLNEDHTTEKGDERSTCSSMSNGRIGDNITDHPGNDSERYSGGFEHLLHLFRHSSKPNSPPEDFSCMAGNVRARCSVGGNFETFDVGSLTQNREKTLQRIQEKVAENPSKLAAIEKLCPQWKENVKYSLLQSDESTVREALVNVERSRQHLADGKSRVLDLLQEQDYVLELYEFSLRQSLLQFEVDVESQIGKLDQSTKTESCLDIAMSDTNN